MSIEAMKQLVEALERYDLDYEERLPIIRAGYKAIEEAEKQESVALDVTLDEAAVEMLNAFSSPSPHLNDYSELRLMLGEGHSGYGLYLSLADYPEEGSELLINTHPPKREWIGLMIDEIDALVDANRIEGYPQGRAIARAVEDKLKEKNHG